METNAEAVQTAADEDVTRETRRVWKNVIIISISFAFNFGSFGGLTRLQSTLNRVEGMGVITLSIMLSLIHI